MLAPVITRGGKVSSILRPPVLASRGRPLPARGKLIIPFYLFRDRTLGLSELERAIPGITEKTSIQQLRRLERDGAVSRLVHATVPPKGEYSLTALGQDLCPALDEMLYWAQRWKAQRSRTAQ